MISKIPAIANKIPGKLKRNPEPGEIGDLSDIHRAREGEVREKRNANLAGSAPESTGEPSESEEAWAGKKAFAF